MWNFRYSRANNSKMSRRNWSKIKLIRAFILVLDTSNFEDDSIKKRASKKTPFFPYKTMGQFLDTQGQLTL